MCILRNVGDDVCNGEDFGKPFFSKEDDSWAETLVFASRFITFFGGPEKRALIKRLSEFSDDQIEEGLKKLSPDKFEKVKIEFKKVDLSNNEIVRLKNIIEKNPN